MIDLHCHVLPGVDDGPGDPREALALARAAAAGGVRVLAATPHCRADHPDVRPIELAGRCRALNSLLLDDGIAVDVVPGGECDLAWAEAATDEELALVSLEQRGTDLLVETPYGELSPDFEERLLALAGRGPRVLLAHPERSESLRAEPRRVAGLVDDGVLVQVTARSMLPGDDSPPASAARELLGTGVAHVLASDAHGAGGPAPQDLAAGVAAARDLAGARADWMASDVPAAILAGEPLPPPPDGVGGPEQGA